MSYGDAAIPYAVVRTRRKTAEIIIERDGSVLVRAPEWADDARVARIVGAKRAWIEQSLSEWRELNASRVAREYKSGEGFLYLGRAYRLLLVDEQAERVSLHDGRLCLRRAVLESGGVAVARQALREFYVSCGREKLPARVARYAAMLGASPRALDVRELGYRWAACSPDGDLAFHWRCMMAPWSIIDYIVVHELCHLRHADHSPAFWNEVDKLLPDYRERKEWLRRNGAGLDV